MKRKSKPKQKTEDWLRWSLYALLVMTAIAMFATLMMPSTVAYSRDEGPKVEVKDALDLWLDELETYECRDCPPNYRRIDSNDKYSYSCLQFQEATFRGYAKRYGMFPEAEDHEFLNVIYDCDIQKELAKKMIEEDPKNWRHWYHSVAVRGLGEPPVID